MTVKVFPESLPGRGRVRSCNEASWLEVSLFPDTPDTQTDGSQRKSCLAPKSFLRQTLKIFERNLFQGLGDARSSVSGHCTSGLLLVPAFLLKFFDTSSSLVIMIVRMFNRVD